MVTKTYGRVMDRVGYGPTNNFAGFFLAFTTVQLNPFTTATLGKDKKVKVAERFKQESVYGLSTKKSGCCREVTVSGGWTVLLTFELKLKAHNVFSMKKNIFS